MRVLIAIGLGLLFTARAAAQQPTIWLDALASSARPPAEIVNRTTGVYGLLGGRANWAGVGRSFDLGAYVGVGTRAGDGRWGTLSATGSQSWQHGSTSGSVQADFLGLHYSDPFRYTAGAVTLRPTVARPIGSVIVGASVDLTLGGWQSSVRIPLNNTELRADSSGPLRAATLGGVLSLPAGSGTFTLSAGIANAVNGSRDGTFENLSAQFAQRLNDFNFTAELALMSGPGFSDTGGALRAGRALGPSMYASAEIARVVSDPLFGSRGYTGATLSLSWRLGSPLRAAPPQQVAVIGGRQSRGRRVEFRLQGVNVQRAAVVGTFTNWQPRAMQRRAGEWSLEMTLPPGTHQFAFLLDGETWYLPKDAPGVVDDGFGRRNATLIITGL